MDSARPQRICAQPGCPAAVVRGFCAAHQREKSRQYAKAHGGPWLYGRRWRRSRAVFLALHPWCVDCGCLADEVDHVIPHRGDLGLFWDETNWAPRCKACHSRKTASETWHA